MICQGTEKHDRDLGPETNLIKKIMMITTEKGTKIENIKIEREAGILVIVERKNPRKKRRNQEVIRGDLVLRVIQIVLLLALEVAVQAVTILLNCWLN